MNYLQFKQIDLKKTETTIIFKDYCEKTIFTADIQHKLVSIF